MIVGYAFMAVSALTLLAWASEVTLRKLVRHCLNWNDFRAVLVRFAEERRRKRVAGVDE